MMKIVRICLIKISVSFANKRWDTRSSSEFLDPTEKLDKSPLSTEVDNILLKASMTITNNKGDKQSLCPRPRELLKNSEEEPLTKLRNAP